MTFSPQHLPLKAFNMAAAAATRESTRTRLPAVVKIADAPLVSSYYSAINVRVCVYYCVVCARACRYAQCVILVWIQ